MSGAQVLDPALDQVVDRYSNIDHVDHPASFLPQEKGPRFPAGVRLEERPSGLVQVSFDRPLHPLTDAATIGKAASKIPAPSWEPWDDLTRPPADPAVQVTGGDSYQTLAALLEMLGHLGSGGMASLPRIACMPSSSFVAGAADSASSSSAGYPYFFLSYGRDTVQQGMAASASLRNPAGLYKVLIWMLGAAQPGHGLAGHRLSLGTGHTGAAPAAGVCPGLEGNLDPAADHGRVPPSHQDDTPPTVPPWMAPERAPVERRSPAAPLRPGVALRFENFYRKEMPQLTRFVMRLGADRHLAADVAQSAFTEALPQWDSIRDARAWLRRVAARMLPRHRSKEIPLEQMADQPAPWRDPVELQEEARTVYQALAALPEGQRLVMAWKLDGYEYAEIAEHLGITEATARQRHKRARTALKSQLRDLLEGGAQR